MQKTIPLVIFLGLLAAATWLLRNPPESERRAPQRTPQLLVDVIEVKARDFPITLESYGTVQPQTRSALVSQANGQITSISPSFRDGGFFAEGDVLLTIDPRDYQADVQIAEAALLDAKQLLSEENARSVQAQYDWNRLGNSGEAPDLVKRTAQRLAAEARVLSAEAALNKSELALERTQLVAPFDGRILNKHVDVGQVVSSNALLADIYATDLAEIRLPIRNRDLAFIDLPEANLDNETPADQKIDVVLSSELAIGHAWRGTIVRTEGAIDEAARQLHVIAEVNEPFDSEQGPPLKIGQYVSAMIQGRTVANSVVVPAGTIYQGTFVYVVSDGLLQRREVVIDWQNEAEALIADGLALGELLVTTPLGQVTSGIPVNVNGADAANVESAAPERAVPRQAAGPA